MYRLLVGINFQYSIADLIKIIKIIMLCAMS